MNQQQATFEHILQRLDRQESQHEDMMAYLRSVFPPPPPQPWYHRDPLVYFLCCKSERYLGLTDVYADHYHICFICLCFLYISLDYIYMISFCLIWIIWLDTNVFRWGKFKRKNYIWLWKFEGKLKSYKFFLFTWEIYKEKIM